MTGWGKDRGTALIAALLLVALMAAVSVQLIDLTRFSVFRTAQIDTRTQSYWYARGARDFAEQIIVRSGPPSRSVMRPNELWLTGPHISQIDDGLIEGRIVDGNNCININALSGRGSSDTDLQISASDRQAFIARMFTSLAEELGIPAGVAERLKNQMIDWIDTDTRPEPGGAEDAVYGNLETPYRAANQRFYELEELLALPDMTPEWFEVLRPWLCVRPSFEQPALNLNTLHADQAVLLTALFHGDLALSDSQTLLFRRPIEGYDDPDGFWSDHLIARMDPAVSLKERTGLRTQWFEMHLRVRYHDTDFEFSQLTQLSAGGVVTAHHTRFGAF